MKNHDHDESKRIKPGVGEIGDTVAVCCMSETDSDYETGTIQTLNHETGTIVIAWSSGPVICDDMSRYCLVEAK